MSKPPNHFYEFSSFRLEPGKRQLLCNGARVSLPPKAFDTLLILIQNDGQAVKKDDLIKAVWPDSFVDENNLNQYVSLLRKRLGGGMRQVGVLAAAGDYVEAAREYQSLAVGKSAQQNVAISRRYTS